MTNSDSNASRDKRFLNDLIHPYPVGVEYCRAPVPPMQFWDEDFRRIRAGGMRIVRSFTCWNWQEPAPRCYEFDDLDRLFGLAHKHDLKVWLDITVATHVSCPEWLLRLHPDIAAVRRDGSVQPPTSGPWAPQGVMIHNFGHPKWKEYAADFIRAIVTRFKDHPAMGVWGTCDGVNLSAAWSGGEGYPPYNHYTIAKYIAWLNDRYTLEELNQRTLRRWRCWEDVQPPRSNDNLVEMKPYRQFHYENLAAVLAWMTNLVDELDGRHEQRSHGTVMPREWDEACSRHVVSWGLAFRSAECLEDAGQQRLANNYFGFDWARSIGRNGRWWAEEIYAGNQGRLLASTRQSTPAEDVLPLWLSLVAGAAGALYWQYRPEYMSFEAPGLNLVALDGTPTPRWVAVADAIEKVDRIADHLPLTLPRAEVAVVYSAASHEIFHFAGEQATYCENLTSVYGRPWRSSIPCGVVTPEMDWSHYKLIYLPNLAVIDDASARRIRQMLQGSTARLIADGFFGCFHEKGHWSFSPPEQLGDLFPARIQDFDKFQSISLQTAWGPTMLTRPTDSAILVPQKDAPSIASANVRTLAIETSDGRLTWFGFSLASVQESLIGALFAAKKVVSDFEFFGEPLVAFRRASRTGQTLVFLFNFTAHPVRSTFRFRWSVKSATDLMSETPVRFEGERMSIDMPEQSMRLLALE